MISTSSYSEIGSQLLADAGANNISIKSVVNTGFEGYEYGGEFAELVINGGLVTRNGGSNSFSLIQEVIEANPDLPPTGISVFIEGGLLADSGMNNFTGAIATHYGTLDYHITGGMHAGNNGFNRVTSAEGDTRISITGDITADTYGSNLLFTGSGNDIFSLNGKVGVGALDLGAGGGYNVLSLQASSYAQFAENYQAWLEGMGSGGSLSLSDGAVRVDMGSLNEAAMNSLRWLDQLIDARNESTEGYSHLDFELNIDHGGSRIQLSDLLGNGRGDMFNGLDMSGRFRNTLNISGDLDDNGMEDNLLRVFGDTGDRVVLSGGWVQAESNHVDITGISYTRFTNAADELLVQTGVAVSIV